MKNIQANFTLSSPEATRREDAEEHSLIDSLCSRLIPGDTVKVVDTPITDQELLLLNTLGLFPGPDENPSAFLRRVKTCFDSEAGSSVIDSKDSAFNIVEDLYDIRPNWLSVIYSNRKLAPWEGASTWIVEEKGICTKVWIQLRSYFKDKETYCWLYRRKELLAHEMVHAARMAFNESHYEELLAYQTAPYPWRRWLGPLIESPKEAACFMASILLSLGSLYTFFFFPYLFSDFLFRILSTFLPMLPLLLLSLGLFRLINRHRSWRNCLSHLEKVVAEPSKARAVALRLTDVEISNFAKSSPDEIRAYIQSQRSLSLRWKVIFLSYFASRDP